MDKNKIKWWKLYNFEKKPKLLSKRKVNGVVYPVYLSVNPFQVAALPNKLGILIGEYYWNWNSKFRNAAIAHELGHIHLGDTEWSFDRMLNHQLSRKYQQKEAIDVEILADTWAATNTRFGQELLELLEYYVDSSSEKEMKARIKNLKKVLKK